MSLDLDSRQRAMLAEMGLKLFEPLADPAHSDDSPPAPPRQAAAKPAVAAGLVKPLPPAQREVPREPVS